MAMDGLYACNAGAVAGDAMDGLYACNAGRLHGCRRYASMDGCGRTASGTAVESNAGAVVEQLLALPWMTPCRQRAGMGARQPRLPRVGRLAALDAGDHAAAQALW